jgi:O-antigen/teichoic acid export membrane protein
MLNSFRRALSQRQNVRAHLWQSLANYTQAGGGMLLGIVLARLLDPSVFGELIFITAALAFLMLPVSFSTAQLLISDAGKTPDLFKRVWGLTAVVCVAKAILATCFVLYWFWRGECTRAQISVLVGIPMVFADFLVALRYDLEGQGRFKPNFIAQILDIFVHATVAVSLVLKGYGIYGLACGGLAAAAVQGCLYSLLCGRDLSLTRLPFPLFLQQIRSGFWLWLGSLASGWYFRIDKILLGAYGSPTQLGLYNRAMNYGPISHVLLNSLMTNASVRGFSITHGFNAKRRLLFRTMAILLTAAGINGLFWMVAADEAIPFIFGHQWLPAAPSFAILGWLAVPFSLLYGSASLLYSEQRFKTIAVIHVSGLLLLVTFLFAGMALTPLTSVSTGMILLGSTLVTGFLMFAASLHSLSRSA